MRPFTLLPLLAYGTALPTPAIISRDEDSPSVPSAITSRGKPSPEFTIRQSNPINEILALISELFPLSILVEQVGDLITIAETAVAKILDYSTSENDLLDGRCGNIVIIFARGTTEPGNVGSVVGPPFFKAVRTHLSACGGTLAVQGVDQYTASVTGFLQGGDADGSSRMAALVARAKSQCPSSKLVMSGYSQGGQVIHNAAKQLPAETMASVSSIIIFGDPDHGYPVANVDYSKILTVCHIDDNICDHGDLILMSHLTYAIDAESAATFVVAGAGLLVE